MQQHHKVLWSQHNLRFGFRASHRHRRIFAIREYTAVAMFVNILGFYIRLNNALI